LLDAEHRSQTRAIEEVARLVAQIRCRWPRVRIPLRADSGFAREDLMAWCEANGVDFLFGLAKNERLIAEIETELDVVAAKSRRTGRMERRFKSFIWMTRRTWSRRRRIVAKAEWTHGEANPRFVVTDATNARPSTCMRSSTAHAATWRTGSRNASSTSVPTAPRPHHAGQSTAAVVCLHGLRAALCLASYRSA
jgi:Transposase DDE domain group 1